MNIPTAVNPSGRGCTPYKLLIEDAGCIEGYTTVQIRDKQSEDEEFPIGAIIGIAVGGTIVFALVVYLIQRRRGGMIMAPSDAVYRTLVF